MFTRAYPLNSVFMPICLIHGTGFRHQGKRANTVLPEFVYPMGTCDAETCTHVRTHADVYLLLTATRKHLEE